MIRSVSLMKREERILDELEFSEWSPLHEKVTE
jgi:hypothetical protein